MHYSTIPDKINKYVYQMIKVGFNENLADVFQTCDFNHFKRSRKKSRCLPYPNYNFKLYNHLKKLLKDTL